MRHGPIQCVATDECCCPLEVKLKGSRIDDTFGGNSGVEPRVPLMYTQMVRERGFSLEEFVALVQLVGRKDPIFCWFRPREACRFWST
jgi:dihydropyrimidinase